MKKLNIVFSVVLIAVAAFFFFYADTFKMLPGQTEIGPALSPRPFVWAWQCAASF